MTRAKIGHASRGVMGVIFAAAISCGGSGSPPTPVEPNVAFECKGTVSDGAGDVILLPTGANNLPALDICAVQNITFSAAITQCTDKCDGLLQSYADAINSMNGTMVTVSQLTCNVNQFEQIASDCPNMDPPGVPEPPFSGGTSQYVANLSGQVNFSVDVDTPLGTTNVSSTPATSGQIGYTIIPLDRNCPPQGCELLITSLSLDVADFELSLDVLGAHLFGHDIKNLHLQNAGWVVGTWQPNGQFTIPAQAGDIVITASDNGTHTSLDRRNGSPLTGVINPGANTVSFDNFSQSDGNTTITVQNLSGSNVSTPPVAVISTPQIVECNRIDAADVILDGSASQSNNGPLHFFTWVVNGGPPISGVQASATLGLGPNDVVLNVFNQTLGIGQADETITVVDTTPPTIQPVAPVIDTLCNPNGQSAVITPPIATDICSPTVTVTGQVVSANGTALGVPIPIVNGQVQLAPGTYVVLWTATDQSGQSSSVTQSLTVRPGLSANGSVSIDDRAQVKVPGTGFAMLGNGGTGLVDIGVQSQTGPLVTRGGVFLRDRSTVNGNLVAGGAITKQNLTVVNGTVTSPVAIVNLPPGLDLTGVTFPTTNQGPVTLQPDTTQTLAPGSYTSVTIFSRSHLTLSAGTYFMTSLDLEPQAHLNLDQSAGPVLIYVRNSVIDRGQIASIAGTPGGFVLGYAGTQGLFIQTPFLAGTLIAPNAKVTITSLGASAFTGELFAHDIEVQPDAILTCDPIGRSAQQAGVSP